MTDLDLLTLAISRQFGSSVPANEFGWPSPALNVLDCVLSLNRKYTSFVLPRVTTFSKRHPDIYKLIHLRGFMNRYSTPNIFLTSVLNYNHADRARILDEVLNWMIRNQDSCPGDTEEERLRNWATSASPGDAYLVGIKGFGLAGFQYMRMLFGAQTTKPDIHITRFVSTAVGHQVTPETALLLLEQAATSLGLPVRDLDNSIWQNLTAR